MIGLIEKNLKLINWLNKADEGWKIDAKRTNKNKNKY